MVPGVPPASVASSTTGTPPQATLIPPSNAFTTMTWVSAIRLWSFWPAHKQHQARCWSKKVNVRCQASLADSSWYELRASQWKPWLASG